MGQLNQNQQMMSAFEEQQDLQHLLQLESGNQQQQHEQALALYKQLFETN